MSDRAAVARPRCHNPRPSRRSASHAAKSPGAHHRPDHGHRTLRLSAQRPEKRAFKRTVYHVRDDEPALDIVGTAYDEALAEHYGGDKPAGRTAMLFQRILSNTTLTGSGMKTRNAAVFSNMQDFEPADGDA